MKCNFFENFINRFLSIILNLEALKFISMILELKLTLCLVLFLSFVSFLSSVSFLTSFRSSVSCISTSEETEVNVND